MIPITTLLGRGDDPFPYHGPIQTARGTRPWNRYLWPTWSALAEDELGRRFDSRWALHLIELWDGRWSTEGFVHQIEGNTSPEGRGCCFADRRSALRAAAARVIKRARKARRLPYPHSLSEEHCAAVIAWARAVVARETGAEAPAPIALQPIYRPPPPPRRTGLPLFDLAMEG